MLRTPIVLLTVQVACAGAVEGLGEPVAGPAGPTADIGPTWQLVEQIDDGKTERTTSPRLGLNESGVAVVVWSARMAGGQVLLARRSVSGTWDPVERIAPVPDATYSSPVVFDDGTATVAWRDHDAVLTATMEASGRWSRPSAVAAAAHEDLHVPAIVVRADTKIVMWQDGPTRLRAVHSTDAGRWSAPTDLPFVSEISARFDGPRIAAAEALVVGVTVAATRISWTMYAPAFGWAPPSRMRMMGWLHAVSQGPDGGPRLVWSEREVLTVVDIWSMGFFDGSSAVPVALEVSACDDMTYACEPIPVLTQDADDSWTVVWSEPKSSEVTMWESRSVGGRRWADRRPLPFSQLATNTQKRLATDGRGRIVLVTTVGGGRRRWWRRLAVAERNAEGSWSTVGGFGARYTIEDNRPFAVGMNQRGQALVAWTEPAELDQGQVWARWKR